MNNENKPVFTSDQLIEYGFVKTNDEIMPFKKDIENKNPLNASEDSNISLVIHTLFNKPTFAVLLPDGGMLNVAINSIEELRDFEKKITFYDPPF